MKKEKNFLLYGEGSTSNKGCEAILKTTIEKIKNSCKGKIILATNGVQNDKMAFEDDVTTYVVPNQEILIKYLNEKAEKKKSKIKRRPKCQKIF